MLCNYYHNCNTTCSVVRTFQCTMQLTTRGFGTSQPVAPKLAKPRRR